MPWWLMLTLALGGISLAGKALLGGSHAAHKNPMGAVIAVVIGCVVIGTALGQRDSPATLRGTPADPALQVSQSVIAAAPASVPAAGTVYSYDQMRAALQATGMSDSSARTGAAIAEAESGGRSDAVHLCPPRCDPGQGPEQSYGPWQINLLAHPKVTAARAMALASAAQAASAISGGGRDWSAWSTYGNGAYLSFLR